MCAPKEVVDVFVVGELMDRGGKLNVLLGCCWTEKSSGTQVLRAFCFIKSVLSLYSFCMSVCLTVLRAVVL